LAKRNGSTIKVLLFIGFYQPQIPYKQRLPTFLALQKSPGYIIDFKQTFPRNHMASILQVMVMRKIFIRE